MSRERTVAVDLLSRLNAAQEGFYGGGDSDAVLSYMAVCRDHADASLRLHPGELLVGSHDHIASLTDGSAVTGAERRWSTVALYRVRADRIVECRLLPLDPEQFDRIWAVRDRERTRHRDR